MTSVLIVEDSMISREYFRRLLEDSEEFTVAACIENAANAEIACLRGHIDLVLMDVCTVDDESGLTAAEAIKRHNPKTKVIIMTSMPEVSFLRKAWECGCDGFWYKEHSELNLAEVCGQVLQGDFVWPEHTPGVAVGLIRSSELTGRELDVIRALAAGGRYEEIARELHISVNTVKYHVKNILQKTGFHSTVQLVAEVVEKRLILPRY